MKLLRAATFVVLGTTAAVMAAAVLTQGLSGPVLLYHVRQNLVICAMLVSAVALILTLTGARARWAISAILLVAAILAIGLSFPVTVASQVHQPQSERRAMIVHLTGSLDGTSCVLIQSGVVPWSKQETFHCDSRDDPARDIRKIAWVDPRLLRITLGDGATVTLNIKND